MQAASLQQHPGNTSQPVAQAPPPTYAYQIGHPANPDVPSAAAGYATAAPPAPVVAPSPQAAHPAAAGPPGHPTP
jgi:hypothetical protein